MGSILHLAQYLQFQFAVPENNCANDQKKTWYNISVALRVHSDAILMPGHNTECEEMILSSTQMHITFCK